MSSPFSRKGCALGCGGALVVALVLIGFSVMQVRQINQRAFEAGDEIDARFGTIDDFRPSAGPAITPEQLERFIEVRLAVMGVCDEFGGMHAGMIAMSGPGASGGANLWNNISRGMHRIRAIVAAPGLLGEFAGIRNEALLEQNMGMGEYVWIYALVFYTALGEEPVLNKTETRPGNIADNARFALMGMMERRASALRSAGLDEEADLWEQEKTLMINEPHRVPFADGVPAALATVIESRREVLAALFCTHTDALELMRLSRNRLGYEG